MSKKKILVIDDDVQFVDTVKNLLETVGYEVIYSYTSEEGYKKATEEKPDLILLDVMFAGPPGPDGFELSRKLAGNPETKDIPVIIISGVRKFYNFEFSFEPDEYWLPVKAFIERPVKPDKLLGKIKEILG